MRDIAAPIMLISSTKQTKLRRSFTQGVPHNSHLCRAMCRDRSSNCTQNLGSGPILCCESMSYEWPRHSLSLFVSKTGVSSYRCANSWEERRIQLLSDNICVRGKGFTEWLGEHIKLLVCYDLHLGSVRSLVGDDDSVL